MVGELKCCAHDHIIFNRKNIFASGMRCTARTPRPGAGFAGAVALPLRNADNRMNNREDGSVRGMKRMRVGLIRPGNTWESGQPKNGCPDYSNRFGSSGRRILLKFARKSSGRYQRTLKLSKTHIRQKDNNRHTP